MFIKDYVVHVVQAVHVVQVVHFLHVVHDVRTRPDPVEQGESVVGGESCDVQVLHCRNHVCQCSQLVEVSRKHTETRDLGGDVSDNKEKK